jgi:hypothetical protein
MGVALYIVAQKAIKGLDLSVDGKAIGKVDEQSIDALCDALNVASLVSFLSQDPDELADIMGEDVIDVEGDDELPPEEWFAPEDGLTTVRALIAHLAKVPSALPNAAAVITDLRDFECILAVLAEKQVRWHLAVDM